MDDPWKDEAGLRWLFLDLNSFFASAEQHLRPELRGRPTIVAPTKSEYTCAIAASLEAKPFGIRTGTPVHEARKLCPGLIVVEARPDEYVKLHTAIMGVIGDHLPVWKICSIDEAVCELTGPQRREGEARALALRIQTDIRARLGTCLRSSVGIAPSRLLAKIASAMEKPDGLVVLRQNELPGRLLDLPLRALTGIGRRMEARLQARGITSVAELWGLEPSEARRIWGGIQGEQFWYGLHGVDAAETVNARSSISHSHVLVPDLRPLPQARLVVRRLVVKCGSRLRRMGLMAGGLSMFMDAEDHSTISLDARFAQTADTFALLRAADTLWASGAPKAPNGRLRYVGVAVWKLQETIAQAPDLFGWTAAGDENPRSLRLSETLDRLNQKYGKDAITVGPGLVLGGFVGAKIAFSRIPDAEEFRE